jgi:hypothetical protein
MAPLIPIALQLIQFAPHLMRYFGAGETSTQVVESVVDVAKTVTGAATPEEALAAIKESRALQSEFQQKLVEIDADLTKAYLADMQDARKRDVRLRELGLINWRANMLTLGAFLIIALITWKVWTAPDVPEWVKAIVTLVLGRFLGYMDQIFQFEFGATRKTNG